MQPNKQRKKENEIAAVFLIAPRALLTEAEMVMDWHGLSIYKHQKPLGLASVRALTSPLAKMKAAIEQSVRCVSSSTTLELESIESLWATGTLKAELKGFQDS